MQIEDYGIILALAFIDGKTTELQVSSWEDFPDVLVKDLLYARISKKADPRFTLNIKENSSNDHGWKYTMPGMDKHIRSGWTLKYQMKRMAPKLFEKLKGK